MLRAAGKDESRKHYKPAARARDADRVSFWSLAARAAAAARCRRSRSRWAPIRACTPTSASASSPASCPIATPGIRSRRRFTTPMPLMRAVWPGDGAVGAARSAGGRRGRLAALPSWRGDWDRRPPAPSSALLFLLLSNPSLTRLGGIRLRAQCETFIARRRRRRTAAAPRIARAGTRPSERRSAAGMLFGLAFLFKYNAGIYLVSGVLAAWLWRRIALARSGVARRRASRCP